MYRKLSWMVCLLLLQGSIGWSQDYGTLPSRTPLPPNTASLFKAWEKPIGTFTGIPPISIPVYTLEGNGLSVPVTLSYNGGGLRVEEIASSAGLGWNLSAGGMITRIKNGREDEWGQWFSAYKPSQFTGTELQVEGAASGADDLEPDVFMYSVNGMTGSFIVDETEHIAVIQQSSDVKINPWFYTYLGSPYLGGFILTDESGYQYKFGSQDLNATVPYVSGWHLDQVTDINGKLVAGFQYQTAFYSYKTWTQAFTTVGGYNTAGCRPSDYGANEYQTTQTTYEQHLRKIYMGNDTIVFTLGARQDVAGSFKVDRIEVKNKNTVVRKFNLNYDYFTTYGYTPSTDEANQNNMRLRLKNFSQQPVSGTDSLTHTFTYNEEQWFPERLGRAVDYWGYFNGAYNVSLIPNGIYGGNAVSGFGDRRSNHTYTATGALTRITFPTGGYRQFNWEGNQIVYAPMDLAPDPAHYTEQWFSGDSFNNYDPLTAPAYQHTFTVNSSNGSAFFSFLVDGWASTSVIRIVNTTTSATVATFNNQFNGNRLLPNGNYRIDVYYDTYGEFYMLYADWPELNSLPYNAHRNVGGLRIRSIDDYDQLTGKHYLTRYQYFLPSDTTVSSGLLVSEPHIVYSSNCDEKQCDLLRIWSGSNYPLSTESGSYVVYTNVRVLEDSLGYTDRMYNMVYDDEFYGFPAMSSLSRSYARGKLLSTRYYSQAGNLLRLDTTTYYDQQEAVIPHAVALRVAVQDVEYPDIHRIWCSNSHYFAREVEPRPKVEKTILYNAGGNYETQTTYTYYDSLSKKHVKKLSILASDSSSKDVYYSYPFNAHTAFRLPLSTAERSMKDTLLAKNYLAPLEMVTYSKKGNDSVFVQGTKSTYGYFHTTDIQQAATRYFTTPADSVILNYSAYSTAGHVQEQYKTNDAKEVFLWGYNNTYVVARIVGSNYATVAPLVSDSLLQNPSSDAVLRTELNKIRTALAGSMAQVTTYTYRPGIGLTSATDANGKITYYEYDPHARLIRIRDNDNNIIKKFNYSIWTGE